MRIPSLIAALALTQLLMGLRVGSAGEVYLSYQANPAATLPSGVHSPTSFGWLENFSAGAGTGIVNDAGLGVNAWSVTDASSASASQVPNPSYVRGLGASASTTARSIGFRFEALVRYMTDYDGGANMGLTMYLNQRAYHLMFDLNGSGDLQATLFGRPGSPTVMTAGGTGIASYHRIALESSGGASVTALFDGQPIGAAWTGIAVTAPHADTVQWGNSQQAGVGRGVMNFREVAFELGSVAEPNGDFDGDSDIDAGDFLLWQRTLGSTVDLRADASGDGRVNAADLPYWRETFGMPQQTATAQRAGLAAPEPSTLVGLCVLFTALTAMRSPRFIQPAGDDPSRG